MREEARRFAGDLDALGGGHADLIGGEVRAGKVSLLRRPPSALVSWRMRHLSTKVA